MPSKYFKETHLCVVNPLQRKVWDEKKRKQVKKKKWTGENPENEFPLVGYVCPSCETASNRAKQWKVGNKIKCDDCLESK